MIKKDSPSLSRLLIFSILILSAILLTSCTGLTYPVPIPCGDVDALISAINIANSNGVPDTIELDAGCVYEIATNYDNGGLTGFIGLPQIKSDITILGHGAAIVRSSDPATPKFRLFLVGNNGTLFLQDLTLQNGYADDPNYPTDVQRNSGGAIRNTSELKLKNVTIQNNRANGVTGGIFNEGNLEMKTSSISGSEHDVNSFTMGGATALHNYFYGASATIVQSTIYGNGLIGNVGYTITNSETSSMSFENSTISGNGGGALNNDGDLDLTFCTIVGNGQGIHSVWYGIPTVDIKGTIFQNTTDCDLDSSVLTTNMNNMDSDGTCGFAYTVPAVAQGLLPLANNGGATLTHALDPSSPAIDAVIGVASRVCPVPEDQRGVSRPQIVNCDIGAYEYEGEIAYQEDTPTPVPPPDEPGDEPQDEKDPFTPTPVPDRCDLFDGENAKLSMLDIPYGSTELVVIVEFPHPIWGLEEDVPWDDRPWEYTATLGNAVAKKCTYRDYPHLLHCTFDLTKDYFGFAFPYEVRVNYCGQIFYHKAVSVFAPEPPPTKTPTPVACNANLGQENCKAAGGSYDPKTGCTCP